MANRLTIPQRYKAGMRAIAELDAGSFDRVTAALTPVPDRLTSTRLADQIAAELSDSAREMGLEMVEAILSLVRLLGESDDLVDQLAADVAQSDDLDVDDETRERLGARVAALLRLEALSVAARAYDVSGVLERGFHDARVMTDIRPVFGSNVGEGPRAAVVVSTLKIEYHTAEGPLESLFFGLDHRDLVRLRGILDRALEKVESLEMLVSSMDLPYWEYREAEDDPDATSS